jgi:formylglycine-generating enzyme required for sulfatase activity
MSTNEKKPQYRWPWFLLMAIIIGIVLTVFWVLGAVRKVRRIRESTGQNAGVATPTGTGRSWTNGMVWIPSSVFQMGSDGGYPDERPLHSVEVNGVCSAAFVSN